MNYKELKECLVCGYDDLVTHCDLGIQPLVNNLKDSPEQEELKFPILVNACPVCSHKQLSIAVDPKLMFTNYLYQTGASDGHLRFFNRFVSSLMVYETKRVLDIGCNDGSLLKAFFYYGWGCTGVEPSKNLADSVNSDAIPVINDFFPTNKLDGYKFDCITAFNVFAHNSDPHTFLIEMAKLLAQGGKIYILTTRDELGSFYHEHVSYFTPRSMMVLAEKCGLQMNSFKEVSMHGKSYLFELSRQEVPKILELHVSERPVVGYGASANGVVIMNYLNFKPEYVIDDNPLKQGKYIPGVNVPVFNSDYLASDFRDLNIVILAYNLFDEIVSKTKDLRPTKNDVFIHPLKGVA